MNFQVTSNGKLEAITEEGRKLMNCPTERVEYVDQQIVWDVAPYDAKSQRYDLSSYGLSAIEEEYISFLHRL